MFVRAIGNYPPYRDGQCFEIQDRVGGPLVGRVFEIVTAADVQAYELASAAAQCTDSRIGENPRPAAPPVDPVAHPARGRRRVVTEDEWRREIGQDQAGYEAAAMAHRQVRS